MMGNTIYNSERFKLVSWHNGLSYELTDKLNKRSLFVQGDDAGQLLEEIEAWERVKPEKSYDEIYAEIMNIYNEITEPTSRSPRTCNHPKIDDSGICEICRAE